MWSIPYKCTKETRLRTLQWKIMSNIYPTNILLNKMGIAPNRNCTRCGHGGYIEHFFVECPAVRPLWTEEENLIAIWLGRRLTLNFYDPFGSRARKIILKRIQNYKFSNSYRKTMHFQI